jgi:hypothetical protein
MMTVSKRRYTLLERSVLSAVQARLAESAATLFRQQVDAVNHIQRILNWQEIDLYVMRFPRQVRWPEAALFPNRSEFHLAHVSGVADDEAFELDVHAVSGHVFSIESKVGLKQYSRAQQINVESVDILNDPMRTEPEPTVGGDGL